MYTKQLYYPFLPQDDLYRKLFFHQHQHTYQQTMTCNLARMQWQYHIFLICTIVLYHIDGTYEYKEGRTYGKIIDEERGDTSFGYDCLFESDDLKKSFGVANV